MRKIFLLTLILATVIFCTHTASAFDVKLTNTTDQKLTYNLIWLDCDWEGFPKAKSMAAGEVLPGQKAETGADWKPGRWAISWGSKVSYLIIITSEKGVLYSTPTEPPTFVPD